MTIFEASSREDRVASRGRRKESQAPRAVDDEDRAPIGSVL